MNRKPRQLDVDQVLQNSARGGATYADVRKRVARSVPTSVGHSLRVSRFLTDRLFELRKNAWASVPLVDDDWSILERLISIDDGVTAPFYASLVSRYIAANADRVQRLYADAKAISLSVLRDDGPEISRLRSTWDSEDRQSLLAWKTSCAQAAASDEALANVVRNDMRTRWLRERFLYPLIYYFSSNTSDRYIDTFLTFVVDSDEQPALEREVIKLLLKDDASTAPNCVRLYCALLCHPFDACEMLISLAEVELSKNGVLPSYLRRSLAEVREYVRCERLDEITKLAAADSRVAFSLRAKPGDVMMRLGVTHVEARLLVDLCDVNLSSIQEPSGLSRPLHELVQVRNQLYPSLEEFTYLSTNANKWSFVEACFV